MKIIYDDLPEFIEVRLRCENTRKKSIIEICAEVINPELLRSDTE